MPKPHEKLKNWLIEIGASQTDSHGKPYYQTYSGDNEPLDVRLGRRHVSYQPDVIWKHEGEVYVFELAFNEDWRAIAGEIALASLSKRVAKVFIITDREDDKIANSVSMLGEKFESEKSLKYGADHIAVNGIKEAKRKIKEKLEKGDYLW